MRGRVWRLLLTVGAWQVFNSVVLVAIALVLDRTNGELFARLEPQLSLLVWSIVLLLLFDAVVMQLLAAVFAIGTAGILSYHFEDARRLLSDSLHTTVTPRPPMTLDHPPVAQAASRGFRRLVRSAVVQHWRRAVCLARDGRTPPGASDGALCPARSLVPENSIAALLLAQQAVELALRSTCSKPRMAKWCWFTIAICGG